MGYCDHTEAELFALTRQRRAEALSRRIASLPPTIRVSMLPREHTVEFEKPKKIKRALTGNKKTTRSRSYRKWRIYFWDIGVRTCYYCQCEMTMTPLRPHTLTVDHKTPLSRGGNNLKVNLVPACSTCNEVKANRTEAEYREALRAVAA